MQLQSVKTAALSVVRRSVGTVSGYEGEAVPEVPTPADPAHHPVHSLREVAGVSHSQPGATVTRPVVRGAWCDQFVHELVKLRPDLPLRLARTLALLHLSADELPSSAARRYAAEQRGTTPQRGQETHP